jgi:hypothetical protein
MVATATNAKTVFFIAEPFQFFPYLQPAGNAKVSFHEYCWPAIVEFNVDERSELLGTRIGKKLQFERPRHMSATDPHSGT